MTNNQKYLISELAQYVTGKNISVWVLAELREWVESDHSIYENPWNMAGEDGGPLDYLTAKEIVDELFHEKEQMEESPAQEG